MKTSWTAGITLIEFLLDFNTCGFVRARNVECNPTNGDWTNIKLGVNKKQMVIRMGFWHEIFRQPNTASTEELTWGCTVGNGGDNGIKPPADWQITIRNGMFCRKFDISLSKNMEFIANWERFSEENSWYVMIMTNQKISWTPFSAKPTCPEKHLRHVIRCGDKTASIEKMKCFWAKWHWHILTLCWEVLFLVGIYQSLQSEKHNRLRRPLPWRSCWRPFPNSPWMPSPRTSTCVARTCSWSGHCNSFEPSPPGGGNPWAPKVCGANWSNAWHRATLDTALASGPVGTPW